MTVLAIDTSGEICAAALFDHEQDLMLAEESSRIGRGHAELLMDQIQSCLSVSGKTYHDLSRIGVVKGPGSFTGLRVSIAAARGLAFSLEVPVIGISSLEALEHVACQSGFKGKMATVLDAKRGQAYLKISGSGEASLEDYENIKDRLPVDVKAICGSGSDTLNELASGHFQVLHRLSASPMLAIAQLTAACDVDQNPPEPEYIRAADAKPQTGFTLKRA